jgi:RNA polymerase sigma-70 factor (ECF subfamily)
VGVEASLAADSITEPTDPRQRALLDRYAAFDGADIGALMGLLTDDAVWELPPTQTWYTGRETVGRFLATRIQAVGGQRMVAAAVNGQPGFGAYTRHHNRAHRPHALRH